MCSSVFQANGLDLKGNFHDNVVRILKELPIDVCLVCARKSTGNPSPLRGTIVDNVDTGKSEKAFASRVSTVPVYRIPGFFLSTFLNHKKIKKLAET